MSETLLFAIQGFIWLSTQESSSLGRPELPFLLPFQDIFVKVDYLGLLQNGNAYSSILLSATDFHSDDL